MKKILSLTLVFILGARSAHADSCSTSIMPAFNAAQASAVCGKFGAGVVGVLANADWAVGRNVGDTANINVWQVSTNDDTVFNSSASDDLILQLEDDASRVIFFDAGSDAALRMAFGDAGTTATQILLVSGSTSDADDDSSLRLTGGGAFATDGTRGATIVLPGEEVAGGSDITYNAGAGDTHLFQVAGTTEGTLANDSFLLSGAAAVMGTSGATSLALQVSSTSEVTLTDDQLAFSGAAAQIVPGATSLTIRNNADAVNNVLITDAGEVTMAGASLGWAYVTGANTACTTTCTFAAVFGVDLAAGASAPVIVGPASAAADACVCAGAS